MTFKDGVLKTRKNITKNPNCAFYKGGRPHKAIAVNWMDYKGEEKKNFLARNRNKISTNK